jgi:hypothetical protein
MNTHRVIPLGILLAGWLASPATVLAQAEGAAKKAKKAAAVDEAAEKAEADKLATLEAAQEELKQQIAEMREQLAADQAAAENKKAVEALEADVAALNQKIDAQATEAEAKSKAMEQQISELAPTKGFTIKGPGESSLTIGGLLRARLEGTKDASPNGKNWDFDTYLRRMRIMVYGKLNKWVNFFVETDNPNFGKSSDWSPSTFIQDAYLEVNIHEAFQIDIGMLLLPFSHHGMQGAVSLFGMDYHSALIKYPSGGHKVWRDAGLMLRGLFAGGHVEYRAGIFNGAHGTGLDPRNPDDLPRLTGRLTFNVFEPEGGAGAGGMFYDGLYLAKTDRGIVSTKRVLSFGSSVDWQPDLNVEIQDPTLRVLPDDPYVVEGGDDYVAGAWDAFWDIPLGAAKLMSINGQVNMYYYYYGDRSSHADGAGNPTTYWYYDEAKDTTSLTGFGLSSEVGFRYSAFQPLVLIDFFNATKTDGDQGDYLSIAGGFNYYLFGHNTTFKLQMGCDQVAKSDDWGLSAKFQAQLLF